MFEWGPWSLFAPPLNSWHRLINGARQPVKFLAVTNAPLMMDTIHSEEYIFNCPYVFSDRYSGADGYFNVGQKRYESGMQHIWETNFIMDIQSANLEQREVKGAGVRITQFELSGNSLIGHLAQWPAARYHKAHYHSAGAILLGLQSSGYVLLWSKSSGPNPIKRVTAKMWSRSNGKPAAFTAHPEDGSTSTSIPARNRRAISRCGTAAAFIRSDLKSPTSAAKTAFISTLRRRHLDRVRRRRPAYPQTLRR